MYLIVEPEPVVEAEILNDTKSSLGEQSYPLLDQKTINGKIE